MRLAGKVAVITGGASGIGAASARAFAREGAHVVIVDREEAAAGALAAEIGGEAFAADVADGAAATRIAGEVLGRHGRIDVLMTSAGISIGGTILTIDEAGFDRVFAINVKGTWLWIRAALPAMIEAGRGSVVTVGSQLAVASLGNNAAYVASKGAIASLTKTLAVDHAKSGVRFNAVMPGATDTPMVQNRLGSQPEALARLAARHAMGRLGRPEEIAAAALFLASDEASFVTGHLLLADGGWAAA